MSAENKVGPILEQSTQAEAIVEAIRRLNNDVDVIDRGGYLRVEVTNRCLLTREEIERVTGTNFVFPTDLEAIMTSFSGRLSLTEDEAVWSSTEAGCVSEK